MLSLYFKNGILFELEVYGGHIFGTYLFNEPGYHSVVVSFCHIGTSSHILGYFYTCQDIPTEHVTPPNVRSVVKLGRYSYIVEVD